LIFAHHEHISKNHSKITLPQGLTEALRVSMAGLAGLRAEIEKRMAEKDVTVTQIVEMILAGSIALTAPIFTSKARKRRQTSHPSGRRSAGCDGFR